MEKVVIKDNIFYLADVLEALKDISDKTVDLVFTSPPYNVGIEYENHTDKMRYSEYLNWIKKVIEELYRVIKDDGRFVINIPSITDKVDKGGYQPLFNDIINISHQVGFKIRNDIIWYKDQVSKRTAWGSFASPSDPYIIQPYEYILVFNKKFKKHVGKKEDIDITKEEFINYSLGFWKIPPETRKDVLKACPTPFPEELAKRVIKFYSYKGDTVLDPFGGSGTTAYVSILLGRKAIYIDNSKKAFNFAIKRVKSLIFSY
jgi:site-specific DNA-methyltransferase (adenine-specific)